MWQDRPLDGSGTDRSRCRESERDRESVSNGVCGNGTRYVKTKKQDKTVKSQPKSKYILNWHIHVLNYHFATFSKIINVSDIKTPLVCRWSLFFHSNLLHTSGPNNSDLRRWAFLVAYNTKANNPVIPHHHPQYTPLEKVKTIFLLIIWTDSQRMYFIRT